MVKYNFESRYVRYKLNVFLTIVGLKTDHSAQSLANVFPLGTIVSLRFILLFRRESLWNTIQEFCVKRPILSIRRQETIHSLTHTAIYLVFTVLLWERHGSNTRVGTLIVATFYLQLIQNRYMFRSFTVLQCSHQHCVQPVASDVEVVGYL